MAEFLTTKGVSYKIENIIRHAQKEVVLVSPFLQLSPTFLERLKEAELHNVNITIIYGKNDLKASEADQLSQLKKLNLYFLENLHAKCFYNEAELVITSMNMYSFSEENNREMGICVTKRDDTRLYEEAVRESVSILNAAQLKPLKNTLKARKGSEKKSQSFSFKNTPSFFQTKSNSGHCIRCGNSVPFDTERPYCGSCFQTWAQFENPDYEEYSCHRCGKENYSTMIKPVCYSCYKSL